MPYIPRVDTRNDSKAKWDKEGSNHLSTGGIGGGKGREGWLRCLG